MAPRTTSMRLVFPIALIVTFAVTLSYPIGLLLTAPMSSAFHYARHDPAWSFHSLFLVPVAVGLLASCLRMEYLQYLAPYKRILWAIGFAASLPLIYLAVPLDAQVIPMPDRISNTGGLRAFAATVDDCLRAPACDDSDSYLAAVEECRGEYGNRYDVLLPPAGVLGEGIETDRQASLGKSFAYLCALVDRTGGDEIDLGPMETVIMLLKFVLMTFVWAFIYYTLFLALNFFNSVREEVLYPLLGCFVILVTWFPLQLYAEWYQWYGDLSHVQYFNDSFWGLLAVAILLFVLFVVWIIVLVKKANLITAVAGVHTALVILFSAIFGFNPEIINTIFNILARLNDPIFVALMFVILLYMGVYIRLCLGASQNHR